MDKFKRAVIEILLKSGINQVINIYEDYGEDKVIKILSDFWELLDNCLDKKVGKYNSKTLQLKFIEILQKQIDKITKNIND